MALATLLPVLFWDKGTDSAPLLQKAGIHEIAVMPEKAPAWSQVSGIRVRTADQSVLIKVQAPTVNDHRDVASASTAPWVNSNGWMFVRQPAGRFYYDAPGDTAALAAAEAFTFGVEAYIHTDDSGLDSFSQMLAFLAKLDKSDIPAVANIGFFDDGTPQSGEVLNLLVRRNLLVKDIKTPDPKLSLMVKLGSEEYPKSEAENPSLFAEKVRSNLTDEKRSLRIYGSYLVIGRLAGDAGHARVYLINYGASRGRPQAIRVRVLGAYSKSQAAVNAVPEPKLIDYRAEGGATEFTVPELKDYAVIDLSR